MALNITVGKVAALKICSGTPQDLTNEPMNEVNLSADPSSYRPRYTVYEITDPAKRNLDDGTVPVFQYLAGGTGTPTTLTTLRVEYPDCRVYLATALGSADVVKCLSGKYLVPASVSGVKNVSFDASWDSEKIMFLRDTAKRTVLKQKEWAASADTVMVKTCAALTTAITGVDNDIVYTHVEGGTVGNDISIEYVTPGASALSIVVTGNSIVITPNTATTAAQLVEAINKNGQCQDLNVRADLKAGESGAGTLGVMAHTHLGGGLEPTDWTDITGATGNETAIAIFYSDEDNDIRWIDYCQIPKAAISIPGDGINGVNLSFESRGGPNCGPFLRKQ